MQTDEVLALLQDVAAQVITPRFRALAAGEVMEKSPGDLVTVADREAETLITEALLADDPTVLVVGEEAASADPTLLERFAGAEHAFTVDPVDGTKNFVHGSPDHAVMVAELRRGEVTRCWVWQPAHRRGYVAERGAGVWLNGQRVRRAAPTADPAALRVLTSNPRWEGPRGQLTLRASAWCCGVDYPWLADGTVDATLYSRSLPWDHAPGLLLIEETGGVVRRRDGRRYTPTVAEVAGVLAAADAPTWDAVAAQLAGSPRPR